MCKSDNTAVHRRANRLSKSEEDSIPNLERVESTSTSGGSPKNNNTAVNGNSIGYIVPEEPSVVEKLFQAKEDTFYAHKILGFSVLGSYMYRFSNYGEKDCNLAWMTLPLVLHHLSLNLTSFVFDIPKRRVKTGFRIWPEYRIHSLVFTSRNLACIVRLWMLTQFVAPGTHGYTYTLLDNGVVNWFIVIVTCAAADYGSSLSRQFQSPTVRGTDYFDPYANWFASEMQFQLTAVCLSAGYRRYSLHLVGAFIIQFNSFLMTLRRKNVFSHLVLTTTYGIMLGLALLVGGYEDYYTQDHVTQVAFFANVGVILRMGLGVDKYLVWTILAVGMHVIEQGVWANSPALAQLVGNLPETPYVYWTLAFWMTKFTCFGLGLRKRRQKLAKREVNAETGNSVVLGVGGALALLCAIDMLDIFGLVNV